MAIQIGMTRYILRFGLAIALGKLCLENGWHGFSTGLVALFLLYYGAAYLGVLAGLSRHIVKSRSQAGALAEVLKG